MRRLSLAALTFSILWNSIITNAFTTLSSTSKRRPMATSWSNKLVLLSSSLSEETSISASTRTTEPMLFNNYHDDEDKKFEIYCETGQNDLAYMAWKEWMAWAPQDVNLIQNRSLSLIQCLSDQVMPKVSSSSTTASSSSSSTASNITAIASTIVATERAMEVVDMLWKLHQLNYHAFVVQNKADDDEDTASVDDGKKVLVPTPTKDVYGTVISMLAHVGRYDQARSFLQQLEELWYRNNQINSNNNIDGNGQNRQLDLVKPTVSLYNMLLEEIANGQLDDPTAFDNAADIAGSIVNHMESLKDEDVTPTTETYNHLLRACLRPLKQAFKQSTKQKLKQIQGQNLQDDNWLSGVQKADQTLAWMYENSQVQQLQGSTAGTVVPNEESFEMIINAWTTVAAAATTSASTISGATTPGDGLSDATARAELWLNRLEERYVPSAKLITAVIASCCEQVRATKGLANKEAEKGVNVDAAATSSATFKTLSHQRQQAERAQRLLLRMETLYQAGANEELKPSSSLYERVADAWVECGDENQAQFVLQRQVQATAPEIENEGKSSTTASDSVSGPSFNDMELSSVDLLPKDSTASVSSQVAPSRLTSEREIVEALTSEFRLRNSWLQQQKKVLSNEDDPTFKLTQPVTTKILNMIIKELADTQQVTAGQRSEDLLYFMLEQCLKRGNKNVQPDIVTFNSVILAWSKSSHPDSAIRAEGILKRLGDLHNKGFLLDVQPDVVSYNSIIHSYAKSRHRGAATNAERLFKELTSLLRSTKDSRYKPDLITYSSLLNAFANTGRADRAEEILLRMQKRYKSNPRSNPCPDTSCFNQVLYAHARSKRSDAGKRAEMLLRLMDDMPSERASDKIQPDTQSYNIALFAWSNSGNRDAPYRAQMLFETMKEDNLTDVLSYTTLIAAWCKLGGEQGLEVAKRLINEAISEESTIDVNGQFISNVLYSIAMTGGAEMPLLAEEIVKLAKKSNIDVESIEVYNALLNCWAKSGSRHVTSRVMEILNDLEERSRNSNSVMGPNEATYTIVLDALAKSRNSESILMAEKVMEKIEKSSTVEPNVHTYTAMIQNYARSKVRYKAPKAYAILSRMKRGSPQSQPNTLSYNAVLNTCEFTLTADIKEAEETFRVACATFDEMRSRKVKLSHVTYGSFLGVIANHMPKSDVRTDLVELVFKRCVQEGKVSPLVLKKLKRATVSSSLYEDLLEGYSADDLPTDWTCNVHDSRWQS